MALISIIIPAYNAAPWIADAIDSAIAQTHSNCEVIVVDDGSTDGTLNIARRFECKRVSVLTHKNRGAASARNLGLQVAQGDFIQYLDADDLLDREKIATQVVRLREANSLSLACGPWARFGVSTNEAVFIPEKNWSSMHPIDWLCHNFSGRGMMPLSGWLTPRTIIEAVGPWDETLSLNDDGEYFCRVLLAAENVLFCPESISYYRSNILSSLSRAKSPAAWDSAYRSQISCSNRMIRVENSKRTRRACADLFMRLAHAAYPDSLITVTSCEGLVTYFGGSSILPGGGPLFQFVSRNFGWKFAYNLRSILHSSQQ